MEALADFGTVNLLGVRTFTDAIYRVWFNAFDREAAMQFATLLVSVTLLLLLLERLARGRARFHHSASRGDLVPAIRLRGPAAVAAVVGPLALVGLVVAAPLAQLGVWSVQSIQDGLLTPEFATATRNSLLLSTMSAVLVPDRGAGARLRGAHQPLAAWRAARPGWLRSATACRARSWRWP